MDAVRRHLLLMVRSLGPGQFFWYEAMGMSFANHSLSKQHRRLSSVLRDSAPTLVVFPGLVDRVP